MHVEKMSAVNKAINTRNELGIGQMESIDILKILKSRENISIIMTPLDRSQMRLGNGVAKAVV